MVFLCVEIDTETFLMAKTKSLKSFLIPILRRASLRWYGRTEALQKARVARGMYKCASCKESFGRKEVHVDHIVPVVDVKTGFTSWDKYIESLFVESKSLQVLCQYCHAGKSAVENQLRKINR